MKIYLDYIFFINFLFDTLLLLSVSIVLRRNIKIKRILLGAFIGGISIFTLFIKINSLELFLFKIIISIFMVLTTFSFKNIKYTIKNLSYLYMSSMILGGALYFLNIQFSYKQEGLIFYHNGLSINLIFLILFSPIIIYTYIRQAKELKNTYSKYYKVNIKYKNKNFKLNAFLDTGNKLIDPITNNPIVIVDESYFKNIEKYIMVPCNTISGSSLIKCIIPEEIEINNKKYNKKVIIGLSKNIKMEGIDCILNPILVEEI
jgi:stage II sporulation protein GA (sporulation sigma-E factor processing peptidase)